MTSYTNDDLYQMLLHRLRKDRKGSISPEEFESFLRWRNTDYFNTQMGLESGTKINHESLAPFMVAQEAIDLATILGENYVILDENYVGSSPDQKVAHIINVWATESDTNITDKVEVDLLSSGEWHNRYNNAVTGPSNINPIAYRGRLTLPGDVETPVLWVKGGSTFSATFNIVLDYYTYPADPYYDYYTDASGNVTYLLPIEDSDPYILLTGQIARDGKVAGQTVTSASQDLEWEDHDALNILDMIVSDASMALSDPDSFQSSMLERKENVTS